MLKNLMFDSVYEIKQALKPVFHHPYLNVRLQQTINTLGPYDTGAEISVGLLLTEFCVDQMAFGQS